MSRIEDEKWSTLEELFEEYHHPEHGTAAITLAELTDKLRKMAEKGLMEIAWDDEINEPIFRLTDEVYEKYKSHSAH